MMSAPFKSQFSGAVDVVVIGAGHSGLAMSHMLSKRSVDHIVIERGEIANSWRKERWDSLRLLTPNWMTRLPGQHYQGNNPDGYMGAGEVADFISGYAVASKAPVITRTAVTGIYPECSGYRVATSTGDWICRAVVLATGAFNIPVLPRIAEDIPGNVTQVTAQDYKRPDQLPEGGVLVVGASATGVQLAKELQQSGRQVTLAVGEHVRMPRIYRGQDIQWWMLASGVLDQGLADVDDPARIRRVPSPQLVGSPDHATLDINALQDLGIKVVGRLAGIRSGRAQFSGALNNVCAMADLKMNRLLETFDQWAADSGMAEQFGPAERYAATDVAGSSDHQPELGAEIGTVLWATGFRPDYSWLNLPVLDRKGALKHDGGVVKAPGIYALGLPFLRRRKSSFIHGAHDDVSDLSAHLVGYLNRTARRSEMSLAV